MSEPTVGHCYLTLHPELLYRLSRDCCTETGFSLEEDIHTPLISLLKDGLLIIRRGYGWNGPSGIPKKLHTPGMIWGSLHHDALYELMTEKKLGRSARNRKIADAVLEREMRAAGSWALTSGIFYLAVRAKGREYANPKSKEKYLVERRVP